MLSVDRKISYISRFDHWLSNEECNSKLIYFFNIKNINELKEYLKIEKKIIHFFSQYFNKFHFELIILNTPSYPRLFSKKYYSLRMEQIKHKLHIHNRSLITKGRLIITNKRDFLNIIRLALRHQIIYDFDNVIINRKDIVYGIYSDYLDFDIKFFDRGRAKYFLKRNNLFVLDKFHHRDFLKKFDIDVLSYEIDTKKKVLLAKKRVCKLS